MPIVAVLFIFAVRFGVTVEALTLTISEGGIMTLLGFFLKDKQVEIPPTPGAKP